MQRIVGGVVGVALGLAVGTLADSCGWPWAAGAAVVAAAEAAPRLAWAGLEAVAVVGTGLVVVAGVTALYVGVWWLARNLVLAVWRGLRGERGE